MGNHVPIKNYCISEITPSSTGCLKFETLCHMSGKDWFGLGWQNRSTPLFPGSCEISMTVCARGSRFVFTWRERDSVSLHNVWCPISPFQLTPQCKSQRENVSGHSRQAPFHLTVIRDPLFYQMAWDRKKVARLTFYVPFKILYTLIRFLLHSLLFLNAVSEVLACHHLLSLDIESRIIVALKRKWEPGLMQGVITVILLKNTL